VEFATCAKLLSHPDASAPEGWSLRPEVPASMPDVSADGRTYTFTVRPGYRFSPPSNEHVTAETFRHSIERAIGIGGNGRYVLFDIVGEAEFLAGDAEHITGLRASGDILTIELTAPSPDLLERLAVPILCPGRSTRRRCRVARMPAIRIRCLWRYRPPVPTTSPTTSMVSTRS